MKVTMLLADSVQAAEGKLYILGGGWSLTGPDPTPMALALYVQVPWDRTNERHVFSLELVDSDGTPIMMGDQAIVVGGEFEVGRPAGAKQGVPIDVPLAINIGPIPLPPDTRFEWRLTIDEESAADWRLAFSTRPAPGAGAQA